MSEPDLTFGARYLARDTIDKRLSLEVAEGRRAPFADADAVLQKIVAGALHGERVAKLVPPKRKGDADEVELLVEFAPSERRALGDHFEVAEQEKRGSWYLPENEVLSLGVFHLVHWMGRSDRLVQGADAQAVRQARRS